MTSSSRCSGIKLNRPFVGIPSFLRARVETDLDALDADIAVEQLPRVSPCVRCPTSQRPM